MEDVVQEFISESYEAMDRFDSDLLILEKSPQGATEILSSVFRTVHSMKGACGFLGFPKLEHLAHTGENLLSSLRDGKFFADAKIISCLLRMGDSIREILKNIESSNAEGHKDYHDLAEEMTSLLDGENRKEKDWSAKPDPSKTVQETPLLGEILVEKGVATEKQVVAALAAQSNGDKRPLGEILVDAVGVNPDQVKAGLTTQKDVATSISERTVRVDVSLLDVLMNLVGELVLVRNQVLQHIVKTGEKSLGGVTQQLNRITTELQGGVMKTRMQPIKNILAKFPRMVRELSISCGKSVCVEMEGEDTELDRTILEAIKDPLTHVLRNSIDHGIESPVVRRGLGKPSEGTIKFKAYQKDGQVNIDISDDGAGIDCQRVAKKVLEKGLLSADRVLKMSDNELAQLIFLPGFSTAEKITNVSGRGVGMDVVKTYVEKIGGTIELLNRPGLGLTLRIKIPLTLAIIPALIVEASGTRIAIPQINVMEIVRLVGHSSTKRVEWVHGSPVYRLRGNLLPVICLDEQLTPGSSERSQEEIGEQNRFMIVVHADNNQFGVLVHAVQATQEILVKPLNQNLKTASLFAGATIMGDGKVALILDVLGLGQRCQVIKEAGEDSPLSTATEGSSGSEGPKESLLIVDVADHGLVGIPLKDVSRLEEIPVGSIEFMAKLEVVQSRGSIMPLLRLGRLLDHPITDDRGKQLSTSPDILRMVVHTDKDASFGIVVDRILDIVDEVLNLQLPATRPGFRGSAVINGKATEILDLPVFIHNALPSLFAARHDSEIEA